MPRWAFRFAIDVFYLFSLRRHRLNLVPFRVLHSIAMASQN